MNEQQKQNIGNKVIFIYTTQINALVIKRYVQNYIFILPCVIKTNTLMHNIAQTEMNK